MATKACVVLLIRCATSGATEPPRGGEAKVDESLKDAFANPVDDPNLPRVLIIGDSISIGYTIPVRKLLQGKANVHRPLQNCMHTAEGLAKLESWLGSGKWDVIHFNWGIWDTHLMDAKTGDLILDENKVNPARVRVRHTAEQYRDNMSKLVTTLRGTKAWLVWASTTPLLSRKGSRLNVIPDYNKVAAGMMKRNGVAMDDLYSLVLPNAAKWQLADKCHFNDLGYEKLGEQVSKSILDALARKEPTGKKP